MFSVLFIVPNWFLTGSSLLPEATLEPRNPVLLAISITMLKEKTISNFYDRRDESNSIDFRLTSRVGTLKKPGFFQVGFLGNIGL